MINRLVAARQSAIVWAMLPALAISAVDSAQAAFTTVINSPPDAIEDRGFVGSDTQLNLYPGAVLSRFFQIGAAWEPSDNIEVNLNGGVVAGSLGTSGSWVSNTNVVINVRAGVVDGSVGADNANVINVSGGAIGIGIGAADKAVVNVSGGSIGNFDVRNESQLNLFGGDFRLNGVPLAGLSAVGSSLPLNLAPGSLLTGTLADGTPLAISDEGIYRDVIVDGALTLHAAVVPAAVPQTFHAPGGTIPYGLRAGQRLVVGDGGVVPRNFNASWGSVVDVKGGKVGEQFEAVGAVVNVSGGEIGGQSTAFRGAVVNLSGGAIGSNFNVGRGGAFNMTGGDLGGLFEALGGSQINFAGGVVQPYLVAHPESKVVIAGSGFRINGVPVSGLGAVGAERQINVPEGAVLSGTFADGRQFAFSDQIYDRFAAGTLTLRTTEAPPTGPAIIHAPIDAVPLSLQSGQTILVSDGGAIGDDFNADWGSAVTINGGQIGDNFEAVGSMVNVTAGHIGWRFDAFYGSIVNISGGVLEGVVRAHHGSVINFSGGQIGYYLTANSGGVVNISGGVVDYGAQVNDGGVLNLTGGEIGEDFRVYAGTLNMRGGSIGDGAYILGDGVAHVAGGTMGDELTVHNGARLVLTGGDFRLNGVPVSGLSPHGLSTAIDVPAGAVLSGTLRDGTPFAFSDQDGDYFESGAIRLINWYDALPNPPLIDRPAGPTPTGARAGQAIVVGASRDLGNSFNAGWGSSVTVAGGAIGDNFEAVGAQVLMASGSIGDNFDAFYGSAVTIAGGEVGRYFESHNGSTVNITGGRIVDRFIAKDGSVVNVSGGEIHGYVTAEAGSVLNVSGGRVGDWFQMEPSAELNLFGTAFWLNGELLADLLPGESIALDASYMTGLSVELRALLSDGSIFQTYLFADLFEEEPGPNGPEPVSRVTLNSVRTADFNGDHLVDATDLAHWKSAFGAGVEGNAFLAWQRQFNGHANVPSQSSIPEPASHFLLLAAIAGATLRHRCTKRQPL